MLPSFKERSMFQGQGQDCFAIISACPKGFLLIQALMPLNVNGTSQSLGAGILDSDLGSGTTLGPILV